MKATTHPALTLAEKKERVLKLKLALSRPSGWANGYTNYKKLQQANSRRKNPLKNTTERYRRTPPPIRSLSRY